MRPWFSSWRECPRRFLCAPEREGSMTIASIIGAVIIVGAVLYWLIRSEKKEAHHLDGLHISNVDKDKQ